MIRGILFCLIPALLCRGQGYDLLAAAGRGDLTTIRALIRSGADVNARGAHGRTALHEAAAGCQGEAAKLLVAEGANILMFDDQAAVPAMLAAKCPDAQTKLVFNRLMELPMLPASTQPPVSSREEAPWSLQYATAHKQVGLISMLLSMGVNVNALGTQGNRALEIACLKGDAAAARILLEHGANPNLRDKEGALPLHNAALNGNKEVIEQLLARGAEVNAQDTDSKSTPLHFAASFGRLDAVKALVEHGADVSARNAKGQTALQVAISNNQEDVSSFLRLSASAK